MLFDKLTNELDLKFENQIHLKSSMNTEYVINIEGIIEWGLLLQ